MQNFIERMLGKKIGLKTVFPRNPWANLKCHEIIHNPKTFKLLRYINIFIDLITEIAREISLHFKKHVYIQIFYKSAQKIDYDNKGPHMQIRIIIC